MLFLNHLAPAPHQEHMAPSPWPAPWALRPHTLLPISLAARIFTWFCIWFSVEEAVEKLLVLAPPENVVFKQPGPGGLTMKSVAQTINGGNLSFDHFLLTFFNRL